MASILNVFCRSECLNLALFYIIPGIIYYIISVRLSYHELRIPIAHLMDRIRTHYTHTHVAFNTRCIYHHRLFQHTMQIKVQTNMQIRCGWVREKHNSIHIVRFYSCARTVCVRHSVWWLMIVSLCFPPRFISVLTQIFRFDFQSNGMEELLISMHYKQCN